MTIKRTDGAFESFDRIHQIPYTILQPLQANPKGIIQIIHGMSERANRYIENGCAEALVRGGYIVCLSDHVGHGDAVNDPKEYGDVPSAECLIEDVRQLRTILRAKYRYLPYFFLGHSMGSFLLRSYLSEHPDELSGAIIMGTACGNDPSALGKAVASIFCFLGMGKKPSRLFQSIMTSHCNGKLPPNHEGDWISSDPAVKDEVKDRADHGFPFTNRGYKALFGLMKKINDEEYIAQTPRSVPILLISGEADPVGDMGNGVKCYHDMLFDAGVDDLSIKLYPDARHEILNEPIREQVWSDLIAWCDSECENYQKARILGSM